jgi:cell division protein FtsQ
LTRKRRKNYSLYYAAALTAALIILGVLSVTVFFKTKTLSVSGNSVYTAGEIAEASGVAAGAPLLLLDRAGIRQKVLDDFIYIDDVKVSAKFPSTVTVSVTPSVAAASVQTEGGYLLITKTGKVLEAVSEPRSGTVVINGAGAAGLAPGEMLTLEDESRQLLILSLAEKGFGVLSDKLSSVDIKDEANVTFLYDNRLEINVGAYSDMDYKVKFLQYVIKDSIGPNTSGKLSFLPDNSLQFLDSNSIEQNNRIYEQNIATYVATSAEETATEVSDTNFT